MTSCSKSHFLAIDVLLTGLLLTEPSVAGDYANASTYNAPFGQQSGAENQTASPSLRDANGNLTVVNGQFTSANFGPSLGAGVTSTGAASPTGVGAGGTGTAFGGATAVGNQLSVVTLGNNNTVVVNAAQDNAGNQTATTTINGH